MRKNNKQIQVVYSHVEPEDSKLRFEFQGDGNIAYTKKKEAFYTSDQLSRNEIHYLF